MFWYLDADGTIAVSDPPTIRPDVISAVCKQLTSAPDPRDRPPPVSTGFQPGEPISQQKRLALVRPYGGRWTRIDQAEALCGEIRLWGVFQVRPRPAQSSPGPVGKAMIAFQGPGATDI